MRCTAFFQWREKYWRYCAKWRYVIPRPGLNQPWASPYFRYYSAHDIFLNNGTSNPPDQIIGKYPEENTAMNNLHKQVNMTSFLFIKSSFTHSTYGHMCWLHNGPITDQCQFHEEAMPRKRFPHYWPFVWGIHRRQWILLTRGSVTWTFNVSFFIRLKRCWTNCRVSTDPRAHDAHMTLLQQWWLK